METLILDAVKPYLNATFFGFESVQELIDYELTSRDVYTFDELKQKHHHRIKRKEVSFFREITL